MVKNLISGQIWARSAQLCPPPQLFFVDFTLLYVTHCHKLSLYPISRKRYNPNSRKWQKASFQTYWTQIRADQILRKLSDEPTGGQTDGQANRKTDRQTDRQTDGRTDRQTDGQTNRQMDRRTDRWTDRWTDTRTDTRARVISQDAVRLTSSVHWYCIVQVFLCYK